MESRKNYRKVRKESKEKWLQEICDEISNAKDMQKWWEAVNRFRGKKKSQTCNKIKEEKWTEHFEELLNGEVESEYEEQEEEKRAPWNGVNGEEESTEPKLDEVFSMKEIKEAIRKLGNKKAPGEDGIAAEFLKNITAEAVPWIREGVNKMWEEGYLQEGWDTALIIPIYKAGDEEKPENYRGISLLDTGYKLMTTLMTERLNNWIEKERILKESQAGFRKRRGTRDHIFVLNGIINNKLKKKGGKLYIGFIDFKAAFDTVKRVKWKIKAWKKGIKGKMHRMIRIAYRRTYCKVKMGKRKITKKFETKKGVRQGCPMSGAAYGIDIDEIEETLERKKIGGAMIGKQRIYVMKFADDIAYIAENEEDLKKMLKELEKYVKENKMKVNVKKTKILVCRNGGRIKKGKREWRYEGKEVEEVKDFKYLGFWFTTRNGLGKQRKEMAKKAQKAVNVAWGVMKRSRRNCMKERIYLMNTVARSVAMYGVEVWGWEKAEEIERVQRRLCKMALGVRRNTPGYIWRAELGIESMEVIIKERAIRYLKECIGMDEERWPRIVVKEEMRGILNGNPSRWGKAVKKTLKEMGCEETVGMIYRNEESEVIEEKLNKGIEKLREKARKEDLEAIEKSTYSELYKKIRIEVDKDHYWKKDKIKGEDKEVWARARCGNIERAGKKGLACWTCRACGEEKETLVHLLRCNEIAKKVGEKDKEYLVTWKQTQDETEAEEKLVATLKGEVNVNLCVVFKKIEEILHNAVSDKLGQEGNHDDAK